MTVASQIKQTLASLKGAQGTLRVYSMQSRSKETRLMFTKAVEETHRIIEDLESRIKILEFEEPQYKGN